MNYLLKHRFWRIECLYHTWIDIRTRHTLKCNHYECMSKNQHMYECRYVCNYKPSSFYPDGYHNPLFEYARVGNIYLFQYVLNYIITEKQKEKLHKNTRSIPRQIRDYTIFSPYNGENIYVSKNTLPSPPPNYINFALTIACQNLRVDMVKYLVEKQNADIHCYNDAPVRFTLQLISPAHFYEYYMSPKKTDNESMSILFKYLLSKGCNIMCLNARVYLHYIKTGNLPMVQCLTEMGFASSHTNDKRNIHFNSDRDHEEDMYTPYYYHRNVVFDTAVLCKNIDVFKYLHQHLQTTAIDYIMDAVAIVCIRERRLDIIKYLYDYDDEHGDGAYNGINLCPYYGYVIGCMDGDIDTVQYFIERFETKYGKESMGKCFTLGFVVASYFMREKVIEYLLNIGTCGDYSSCDYAPIYALIESSCQKGDIHNFRKFSDLLYTYKDILTTSQIKELNGLCIVYDDFEINAEELQYKREYIKFSRCGNKFKILDMFVKRGFRIEYNNHYVLRKLIETEPDKYVSIWSLEKHILPYYDGSWINIRLDDINTEFMKLIHKHNMSVCAKKRTG